MPSIKYVIELSDQDKAMRTPLPEITSTGEIEQSFR